nr:MAG TPA: hypothetical protein [Caudoviricetes sp.]
MVFCWVDIIEYSFSASVPFAPFCPITSQLASILSKLSIIFTIVS